MALPLTLPTNALEQPAMDYAFLRKEGIRLLESLGGQSWTDFNTHDPGITILEQLCYAITDLAYRINYDIKDLLASDAVDPYCSLHSPAQVLTTQPVTLSDLRKLLVDVPGVKNAWVEALETVQPGLLYDPAEDSLFLTTPLPQPVQRESIPLQGVYRVLIEIDNSQEYHPTDILPEVNHRLHAARGLGQDFAPPIILPGQGIVINAAVEVSPVDDPEWLLAMIYHALSRSISPRIRFYTLSELLDQGLPIDEIMDGPALQHGFIADSELEQLERKIGLRTSDLIQAAMSVEGTLTISRINISDGTKTEDWYFNLDPNRTPYLDIDKSLFDPNGPTIRLLRGGIAVQLNPARAGEILKRLEQDDVYQPLPEIQRDILLPSGRDRKPGHYHSIQHQFPATYGIGEIGLPESASAQRKAQARQLKAYLLFFDQLLANYFAQLDHSKDLFSFYAQEPRTYFSQIIADPSLGLEGIRDDDLTAHAARVQDLTEASALGLETIRQDDPAASERKNRFQNHLLARFGEQFSDYALLRYTQIGGQVKNEQDLIDVKNAFLRDYQQMSAARGCGFDYTQPCWGTENVAGLEKRISRKLGIPFSTKQDLAGLDPAASGGFHLLEHLLLRPGLADEQQWVSALAGMGWQAAAYIAQPMCNDPYTNRISYIFPKWVTQFTEKGFADFIEKTIRDETPAHIRVHLHWLDQAEMLSFEAAYKTWLENVIAGCMWMPMDIQPDDVLNHSIQIKLRDARDRMVQILGIGTPYPLRDLSLNYPAKVAYNRPAAIQIMGGQSGVVYQLCDEDGNPIVDQKSLFQVQLDPGTADDQVLLPMPVIKRDISFTILAIREDKGGAIHLETYLNQMVSIKVGIDTSIPVVFSPLVGQTANNTSVIVNYGDKVSVTVSNTQEGMSYRLISGPQDKPVTISSSQKGNQSSITLVSTSTYNEDTTINVQAYRTSSSKDSAILDAVLTILVRPDPAVKINIAPLIVDYGSGSTVTLSGPQSSAQYGLYKREMDPTDYLSAPTPDSISIKTDEGRDILALPPQKTTSWEAPAGFVFVDLFKDSAGTLTVSLKSLDEDTLLIVQATKTGNQESLRLDQVGALLVRPDTAPIVGVQQDVVESGQSGVVTVDKTQKGVAYQLRLDAGNQAVNLPGYDLRDRGLETVRLEVDLIVEDPGSPTLILPTGAITTKTSFNVQAFKILTGVSAQLTGKAAIDVPPQPGP